MSGIYIPGMKTSKSCFECNLKKIWEDGVQCLVNKGLWMDCDSKHKACPLIPVPDHGDLIDRDALKDVQQADADFFKGSSDYGEKCRRDEALNAVANIVNAPTIIPADKEGEG